MNIQTADPHTLRLIAADLDRQAMQLKSYADRLETQARNSASTPLRNARAARLANAYIFSGMKPETAIQLASIRAKTTDAGTRAALKSLSESRETRRRAQTIARARLLIKDGLTLRQTAHVLTIPKSTLSDWLRNRHEDNPDNKDHDRE